MVYKEVVEDLEHRWHIQGTWYTWAEESIISWYRHYPASDKHCKTFSKFYKCSEVVVAQIDCYSKQFMLHYLPESKGARVP